jgi:hypothetical protein
MSLRDSALPSKQSSHLQGGCFARFDFGEKHASAQRESACNDMMAKINVVWEVQSASWEELWNGR